MCIKVYQRLSFYIKRTVACSWHCQVLKRADCLRPVTPVTKPCRLATSRPLGERSEPFLAAKRPTAIDEVFVPRHMKSDEGLF